MDQQQIPVTAPLTKPQPSVVQPPVSHTSTEQPLEEQSIEAQLLAAANQTHPTVPKQPPVNLIRPPQIRVRLDWEAYSTMPPKQKKKCDFIVEWVRIP